MMLMCSTGKLLPVVAQNGSSFRKSTHSMVLAISVGSLRKIVFTGFFTVQYLSIYEQFFLCLQTDECLHKGEIW